LPSVTTALALAAAGLCLLGVSAAEAVVSPAMPAANMPIGALPAACYSAPKGAVCVNAVVSALDGARAGLGLGPYLLPADFASLGGAKQIFILTNLDRIAYGLPPIDGISPLLGTAAADGMLSDADPNPTALLGSLSSYAWASNWAGDWANAPYAYYEWMYDDGFGGTETSNIDCNSAAARGCWDHRRNILAFAGSGTLTLGVAAAIDSHGSTSYATTLVWTPGAAWTGYSYTWAQAQADGTGAAHAASARRRQALRRHAHRL
jgi:hypothetical protein